jgi:hypothetical protein
VKQAMTDSADEQPSMWVPSMDAVLNRWFTNDDDARASLDVEGGYLLPFRHQFFVTSSAGIEELGLDPADPDWKRIGRDWARPADRQTWERLRDQRIRAC